MAVGERFRMTPERQAKLDAAMRLHDATRPWDEAKSGRPVWPSSAVQFLELVFEEEDEQERQYGQCLPVRWTVTDAGGNSVTVGPCKTPLEAEVKAIQIWAASGIRFSSSFTHQRHEPAHLP